MGSAPAPRMAGNVPKATQVRTATAAANSRTRRVRGDGELDGVLAGIERTNQQAAERPRHRDAERGSGGGQNDAFHERLAQEASARRLQGQADGHLALTSGGAGKHQVGEVGAGDEQHKSGDGQQKLQRGVIRIAQRTDAGSGWIRSEPVGGEDLVGAVAGGRCAGEQAWTKCGEVGGCAGHGPAQV